MSMVCWLGGRGGRAQGVATKPVWVFLLNLSKLTGVPDGALCVICPVLAMHNMRPAALPCRPSGHQAGPHHVS